MDVTPLIPGDRQFIESYGDGRIRVSGVVYERPILVFPDRTVSWPVLGMDDLSPESLAAVAEGAVEVLLIGCGERMTFIPPALRQRLRGAGIVIDPMDTGAACRTYNVLLSEGRRVAAALIPV